MPAVVGLTITALAVVAVISALSESPTTSHNPTTARQSTVADAAVTYLGCVYSRSKTINEEMINISSLSRMSEVLRTARTGEREDYADYVRDRGAAGIDGSIDEIHQQFQASVDEMLTGSDGASKDHILRGTALFQSTLKLATAAIKRLNGESQ